MGTKLKVHNPMGYPPQIDQKHLAPRVNDLAGKTVYLVDCRFDDGDILSSRWPTGLATTGPTST